MQRPRNTNQKRRFCPSFDTFWHFQPRCQDFRRIYLQQATCASLRHWNFLPATDCALRTSEGTQFPSVPHTSQGEHVAKVYVAITAVRSWDRPHGPVRRCGPCTLTRPLQGLIHVIHCHSMSMYLQMHHLLRDLMRFVSVRQCDTFQLTLEVSFCHSYCSGSFDWFSSIESLVSFYNMQYWVRTI